MEKKKKTARMLRDEALERVRRRAGDWYSRAFMQSMSVIAHHSGEVMTAEELRLLVYPHVGQPHHHNVWGAVIRVLVEIEMLIEIGMAQMTTPKSHARRTPVYRLVP